MKNKQIFFNLFSCHKFLEEKFHNNLFLMAKVDFYNHEELKNLIKNLRESHQYLEGHAGWEEQFIEPLLKKANILNYSFQDHKPIDEELLAIIQQLEQYSSDQSLEHAHNIYLSYRTFCAQLSDHFTEEEREILPRLKQHYTLNELEEIDNQIYSQFTAADIVNMLDELLPPCNIHEKNMILKQMSICNKEEFLKTHYR